MFENDDAEPMYEWFLIMEALEIKVNPSNFSDERYVNLTWTINDFNSGEIDI